MNVRPPEPTSQDGREDLASARLNRWWQEVAIAVRAGETGRARRVLRWMATLSPDDTDIQRWNRHLSSQPRVLDAADREPAKPESGRTSRTGMQIAGVIILAAAALLALLLLPIHYGRADLLEITVRQESQTATAVPEAEPTATPVPLLSPPCADLPESGQPLVALVNGQGLSLEHFDRAVAALLDGPEGTQGDAQGAELQADRAAVSGQVLDQLIADALVQQAAALAGITVTAEEIQAYLDREVGSPEAQAELRGQLEARGQAWEDFQRQACQELLVDALLVRVTHPISPTLEMVSARQIVVATQKDAQLALARLGAGEDFARVAEALSVDTATREQGGDLGWLPAGLGLVPPEIEQAAFTGSPGLVQGPFLIGGQYYLVQTVEREVDRPVDASTQRALMEREFELWLAGQLAAADIVILAEAYQAAPGSATPGVTPVTGANLVIPPWLILVVMGLAFVTAGSALGVREALSARG